MWAVEGNSWSPEVKTSMIEFTMLYYFGLDNEKVRRMNNDKVEEMLTILNAVQKKKGQDIDSKMQRKMYM